MLNKTFPEICLLLLERLRKKKCWTKTFFTFINTANKHMLKINTRNTKKGATYVKSEQ